MAMSILELGNSLANFFSSAWVKFKAAFGKSDDTKYTEVAQCPTWITAEGVITEAGHQQLQDTDIEEGVERNPMHTDLYL